MKKDLPSRIELYLHLPLKMEVCKKPCLKREAIAPRITTAYVPIET